VLIKEPEKLETLFIRKIFKTGGLKLSDMDAVGIGKHVQSFRYGYYRHNISM
jgi:hypothetical protein